MQHKIRPMRSYQYGLGLPEIMVGLVIGLIASIVIVQVMGVFEGQKRTTGGSADTQTNGSIALSVIQRQLQVAGFGLPIYSTKNTALKCDPSPTFDNDGDPATPEVGIFPVMIKDGGAAGGSDEITIRSGSTPMGGSPIRISNVIGDVVSVTNNLGCADGDIVLVSSLPACIMRKVATVNKVDTTQINLEPGGAAVTIGATMACMGNWRDTVYKVSSGNLMENTTSSVADIVNIQAQYGISPSPDDNHVDHWVDAASGGIWEATATTPTVANRNTIKAVRIAIVARSGLMEKEEVTTPCPAPSNSKGPCAWIGTAADPAPNIDLTADPNWKHYRYRVFETIVPLRNIIWSKGLLK